MVQCGGGVCGTIKLGQTGLERSCGMAERRGQCRRGRVGVFLERSSHSMAWGCSLCLVHFGVGWGHHSVGCGHGSLGMDPGSLDKGQDSLWMDHDSFSWDLLVLY